MNAVPKRTEEQLLVQPVGHDRLRNFRQHQRGVLMEEASRSMMRQVNDAVRIRFHALSVHSERHIVPVRNQGMMSEQLR